MKGRWLLVGTTVLAVIQAVVLLAVTEFPERVAADVFRNLGDSRGAFFLFGGSVSLLFFGMIWSFVRPKQAAIALVWSPLVAVVGAMLASAWWPTPAANPSVGDLVVERLLEANRTAAAGAVPVGFASVLAGLAAIAIARRARRVAPPSVGWRPFAVAVGGLVLVPSVILYGSTNHVARHDIGALVVPLGLATIALAAASTARTAEEDSGRAATFAIGAVMLAILDVGLCNIGSVDFGGTRADEPSMLARTGFELTTETRTAVLTALVGLVPVLAMTAIAVRVTRPSLRPALLSIVPAVLAGFICLLGARSSLAAIPEIAASFAWPSLDPEIGQQTECGAVHPTDLLWLSHASLTLPKGTPTKPPFDWTATANALDAHDPSGDVWLAATVDDGSFADIAGLLDAMGKSRGPRGLGAASDEPWEGCAVRFVGKTPDGTLHCSEAIAFAVEGCIAGPSDEKVWNVTVLDAKNVALEWRQGPVLITHVDRTLDEIASTTERFWKADGYHRDPYDRKFDHAILRIAPTVSLKDAMRALAAVSSVKRELSPGYRSYGMGMGYGNGDARGGKTPAFKLALGSAAR